MSCKSFTSPDGLIASVPCVGYSLRPQDAAGPFGSDGSLCGSNGGALRPATCCWMILSFHEVYRCSPHADYHGEIPAQAASLACLRRLRISITPNRSTGSEPSSSTFSNLTRTNPPQPAVAYSEQVASAVGTPRGEGQQAAPGRECRTRDQPSAADRRVEAIPDRMARLLKPARN